MFTEEVSERGFVCVFVEECVDSVLDDGAELG
jgi:hypothetical protein